MGAKRKNKANTKNTINNEPEPSVKNQNEL